VLTLEGRSRSQPPVTMINENNREISSAQMTVELLAEVFQASPNRIGGIIGID